MAFDHHRKLLNESVAEFCESFCDDAKGICPPKCKDLCPLPCKSALLQIPPPPPPITAANLPPHKSNGLPLALTISLAILAITFFFFTCYTIYRFYVSCQNPRRRSSRPRGPEPDGGDDFVDGDQGLVVDHPIWHIRTVGLQPSVISAITVIKFKKGDGVVEGTDCAVCLNEFGDDETLRLLPKCNHAFHIPCIDTWLRSHQNCPMCRAGIVNDVVAALSPQEQIIGRDSGRVDESQVGEIERESGNGPNEVRIRVEEDDEIGLKINEGGSLDEVQPMRRSVSVNYFSGSMISALRIGNGFGGLSCDDQSVEVKESVNGVNADKAAFSENCPSNETGSSSSMKRSHSCSAKVLLTRHSSRNRN